MAPISLRRQLLSVLFSHFVTIHFLQACAPLLHSASCLITPVRARHHVISSVTPAHPRPPPSPGGRVGSSHQTGQVCGASLAQSRRPRPLSPTAGATAADAGDQPLPRYSGKADPPLSPQGAQQAPASGAYQRPLPAVGQSAAQGAATGDLQRARPAAGPVAERQADGTADPATGLPDPHGQRGGDEPDPQAG